MASRPLGGLTGPLDAVHPTLAPFTAHALDAGSDTDSEGTDTRELFEDNFDQLQEDDDWIRELNAALGEDEPITTLVLRDEPPALIGHQGSDGGGQGAALTSNPSSSAAPEPATFGPDSINGQATAADGCHTGPRTAHPVTQAEPLAPIAWLDGAVPGPKIPYSQGERLSIFWDRFGSFRKLTRNCTG